MKNRSKILVLILPVLACFALLPQAQAQLSPPPDGDYQNGTTAEGFQALFNVDTTVGIFNTALGWVSLWNNTSASFSTGVGAGTLFNNNGADNTAVGAATMFFNTTGFDNTAVGTNALRGDPVLFQTGFDNNAFGAFALFSNQNGVFNEAMGNFALFANTTGFDNVAIGTGALELVTTGTDNTAIGNFAGSALTGSDSNNIYIGSGAVGFAGENGTIHIGGTGLAGGFACLIGSDPNGFLGSTFVVIGGSGTAANFYGGAATLNFMPGALLADAGATTDLGIDPASGQLAPLVSSARFKEDIKPMDKGSEAIFALNPVTFRYKKEIGGNGALEFGLIAEEVAKVNPSLVPLDADGKPFSVNYRAVTAMLLNEFLKEHKKVEEQQASISQLRSEMQTMVAQLKEQAAQIQKVSAELQVSKPAPQIVVNKP